MKRCLSVCLFFILASAAGFGQTITVTKPAANESIVKGQGYAIQWTKQGALPETVRIVLLNADSSVNQVLATGAPNSGSFNWAVPASLADGQYRIRIKATGVAIQGVSGTFSIGPAPEGGFHPHVEAVRKGTLKMYAVRVVRPTAADSYYQLDTIPIRVEANTAPANTTGDGFDLDLLNETGTAVVTDILSGAMTQASPGIYTYDWSMPRMDSVPDGKYTVRAKSWARKITGLSAPFWIRIPGAEEKVTVQSVIDNSWRWKRIPSGGSAPAEHVAAERPGEARIGWYSSAGDGGTPYLGIIYRARMQFPMDFLKSRLPRFRKATLRLKQSSFGVRKNGGSGHRWTIGKLMALDGPWDDFWEASAPVFKDVPIDLGADWTCDITDLVRAWLSGSKANHGLLVTSHEEDWPQVFEYAVSFYKASIELTFFKQVY